MTFKLILFLILISFVTGEGMAQTNILSTNGEAEKIMKGNYNPIMYKASKVIDHPDSISRGIISRVSPDSIHAYLEKLQSFKNRNTGADTVSKIHGIGAARRWVYSKFAQISAIHENRLIPSYLQFDMGICGMGRHKNIFAVLPGTDTTDKSVILIEGHIDSRCNGVCDTACLAEGMEDNGSGTALVMELARVMSKYSYHHTLVFLITIGEEQGLYGAEAFADYVKLKGIKVKAVLNNDVIGGIICGNTASAPGCSGAGSIDSTHVRLFSFGGFDSFHKGLSRYVKLQYTSRIKPTAKVPMTINIMTPEDRTGRGGDHIPFRNQLIPAIRFTAANENGDANVASGSYKDRQHTQADILGVDTNNDKIIDSFFVDFNYLARNTVINGNAAGMMGISPNTPDFTVTTNWDRKLKVTITTQTQYQKYKVGLRTLTNDWDSVYTFTGTSISIDVMPANYSISVASVNNRGVESLFSKEILTNVLGVETPSNPFKSIELLQNQPNPSDEATMITVMVNAPMGNKKAFISISDLEGKQVEQIPIELNLGINEVQYNHGYHRTGTYIYTLLIDGVPIQSKKMMFIY